DKVVGLHFFNPAHLMKLVEVVPGLDTSSDTINTALELGVALGKLAVRVEECASFLVNRLLGRYINEALWCLQEGIATVEEIDKAAVDFVMPIGPLALRDMNGSDVGLAVAQFNYQEYGDRFLPAPVLEEMVRKNLLGQKTKEGFYKYDEATRKRTGANSRLAEILVNVGGTRDDVPPFEVERLFLPMINEAFLVLQEKVCDLEDLDPALMAGLGMRRGPLTLASELGLSVCLEKIEQLYEIFGERFRPAPLLKRYVWAKRTTVI
ncbi:MAG TPA: 3-hydroxyacyl-CoA dehydrogenase, partial [Chroococcales cyanobacterium]